MKKCIIIPDSYKGSLSAIEICNIMKETILLKFPDCEVITIPIADGGEGTVDCFLYALKCEKIIVETTGPYNEFIKAYYAKVNNLAIMEVASVAGLPLVDVKLNPGVTTTFGLGSMIKHAIDNGCNEIIIGLGGSCTNDGGIGVARALGTVFYNKNGNSFIPSGNSLMEIASIDNTKTEKYLRNIKITAMCDVKNPLYGLNGAAYIFAPQKGADVEMVKILDDNLHHLSQIIKNSFGIDVSNVEGAGAAGGLGAGIIAFLGGTLKPGIETILKLVKFDELLNGTELVFTGEGCIDNQSLSGKAVIGVGQHSIKKYVPVIAVCGSIGDISDDIYQNGITAIFSINRRAMDFSISKKFSANNLKATMNDILHLYKIIEMKYKI